MTLRNFIALFTIGPVTVLMPALAILTAASTREWNIVFACAAITLPAATVTGTFMWNILLPACEEAHDRLDGPVESTCW